MWVTDRRDTTNIHWILSYVLLKHCIEEHMTFRAAAKNWVHAYEASGEAGLRDGLGRGKERPTRDLPKGLSIEEENAWLKAENEYLKNY